MTDKEESGFWPQRLYDFGQDIGVKDFKEFLQYGNQKQGRDTRQLLTLAQAYDIATEDWQEALEAINKMKLSYELLAWKIADRYNKEFLQLFHACYEDFKRKESEHILHHQSGDDEGIPQELQFIPPKSKRLMVRVYNLDGHIRICWQNMKISTHKSKPELRPGEHLYKLNNSKKGMFVKLTPRTIPQVTSKRTKSKDEDDEPTTLLNLNNYQTLPTRFQEMIAETEYALRFLLTGRNMLTQLSKNVQTYAIRCAAAYDTLTQGNVKEKKLGRIRNQLKHSFDEAKNLNLITNKR